MGINAKDVYEVNYTDSINYQILGPVNTNPIHPVVPEKAPIKARGERFGYSK
ncbi:MAG: hypothetical protein G8D91_21805 [gamma proteobacterium symbiont of Clathrolucina costata]